jgi:hypothetical protein
MEAGRKLAEAEGLWYTVSRALNNLASFLADSDPRASLQAARGGMQLAERLGTRSFNLRSNAFAAAFRSGDWDLAIAVTEADLAEALDPLMRAAAIADLIGPKALRGEPVADLQAEMEGLTAGLEGELAASWVTWALAWIAFAAGRDREAHDALRHGGEVFPMSRLEAALEAARFALWTGDVPLAEIDLADAVADPRRGRVVETGRLVIRAGLAALDGRVREALAMYRDAIRSWRDLGLLYDEAVTGLDMVILLDPGDAEVRAAAEVSRGILERLGALPLLDRLDAELAKGSISAAGDPAATAHPATELRAPAG